jgi:hypothetical protein
VGSGRVGRELEMGGLGMDWVGGRIKGGGGWGACELARWPVKEALHESAEQGVPPGAGHP